MAKCDHYIGLWDDYDNFHILTEEELRLKVIYLNKYGRCKFSLEDYFDRRKSTNLIRFKHCPECGEKLDWRKMKMGYVTNDR